VAGGGVSGLNLARTVRRLRPDWRIRVLEKAAHPGGTIRSERVDGSLCEHGPNGFLTNVTHTWDLAVDLGIEDRLRLADPSSERRFLYIGGKLVQLHKNPVKFMASPVLSAAGKARLMTEPFRGRGSGEDESVASFITRRLGPEPVKHLGDAMVTGIFAGDVNRLSLPAAFPIMADFEREHGSMFKGMQAHLKARRNRAAEGGPDGRLASFDEGMQVLIDTLADDLGDVLRPGRAVVAAEGGADGYRITTEGDGVSEVHYARRVAFCLPAPGAAKLLRGFSPEASREVADIEYAGITVACVFYDRSQIGADTNAFGFLAPRGEGLRMLGCIWSGAVFPGHVNPDKVLCRVMYGGVRDPEAVELDEAEIVDLAHRELTPILRPTGVPTGRRVVRWRRGIPQYNVGHMARVARAEKALESCPGLYLGGNSYHGVGVNDCVRESTLLGKRIAEDAPIAAKTEAPVTAS